MEKVFINPVAKEILIKGNAKEGPVDLFSYEGSGNGQTLGNLFLVGNIQDGATQASDDIDVGYVLNLVASLAKREYYINPDLSPKDAFSGTLRKINSVVDEFFSAKNGASSPGGKNAKINIGIFAIAGEQIHISKLGKFKIFLARDGKNIDILNNIQLFNKETTDEREFSNIISGKIVEGDRILAFYPSRSVTAREKSLKESLISSSQDSFTAKLAAIKEGKPEFACVALHIDIRKDTQVLATDRRAQPERRSQPRELKQKAVPELVVADEAPLASSEVSAHDTIANESKPVAHTVLHLPAEPTIPKIIPSEFARGKRELALAKHLRRFKHMNLTPRQKMVAMGGIALVAIIAIVSLKSMFFVSASTRELNEAISEAQSNIKLAESKLSDNDFIGARELLTASIASLTDSEAKNGASKKAEDTKTELAKALDGLDQAVDASLSVVAEIPTDSGNAQLITISGSNFYAYLDQNGMGALAKIASGSIGSSTQIKNIAPKSIFSTDTYVTLVDSDAKKIASVPTNKSTVGISTFSADSLVNYQIYNNNFYGLTDSGIIKITDAALGKTKVEPWLASGTSLPANASLIVVDGDIFVLSKTGVLAKYFKGKVTNETKTTVAPEDGSMLLTNTDSPNLYLVNKSAGRIYVISKSSGAVAKTFKINAPSITSAALGADDTVYILTDNKIWKVN